ncbi:MAG: hypothetical protein ACE37H_12005 [Phycisphaeraceae bacterium]
MLEQSVVFPDGHRYTHRCKQESFEAIAHAVEESGSDGFSLEQLAEQEDLPSSQADVALAFLKERGCVEVRGRRCYPAPSYNFEDAMVEFHWLEHQQA